MNQHLRNNFARRIMEIGVFQDISKSPDGKGFRLALHELNPDAPLSPFYINYRLLQSDYDAKQMAVSLFEQMLQNLQAQPYLLAAIPEAIVPVVSSLSDRTRIPMITPRKGKTHGAGAKIDGLWKPGMTAVLFDDVVTKAGSKLEAAEILRGAGIIVRHVMILTDRQQGGEKELAQAGLQLDSAFMLDDQLNIYLQEKLMTQETFELIEAYRKAA